MTLDSSRPLVAAESSVETTVIGYDMANIKQGKLIHTHKLHML